MAERARTPRSSRPEACDPIHAESPIPAAQREPVRAADGSLIRGPLVERAVWRDLDDNNPNRRVPREIQGYRAVDVVQRLYLETACTPAGVVVVDGDALTAARLLAEDYELADGARPGYTAHDDGDACVSTFGPGAVQLDATTRLREAIQTVGQIRWTVLLPVVLVNRAPPVEQYEQLRLALDALASHYIASNHPRWGEKTT